METTIQETSLPQIETLISLEDHLSKTEDKYLELYNKYNLSLFQVKKDLDKIQKAINPKHISIYQQEKNDKAEFERLKEMIGKLNEENRMLKITNENLNESVIFYKNSDEDKDSQIIELKKEVNKYHGKEYILKKNKFYKTAKGCQSYPNYFPKYPEVVKF